MAGELILIAEDDVQQSKAMRIFLEAQGYRVLSAKDGVEAVELYHRFKNEIALVVLDVRMPKLNGWDAFQEMKKEDPQLKAVVITAYAPPEVRSGMTRGELHGLFIKPYSMERFVTRVSELIGENDAPQIAQSEALHDVDPLLSNRES